MKKNHDIAQRKGDGKWVVWSLVDDPNADLDYHRKSGLPVPQIWVPVAVCSSRDEAEEASRRSRV